MALNRPTSGSEGPGRPASGGTAIRRAGRPGLLAHPKAERNLRGPVGRLAPVRPCLTLPSSSERIL